MNTRNDQGNQHGSPSSSDCGVGKASLVRASNSPTGRTLSRTVSHGEGARATPFAPTKPPSIIPLALSLPGSGRISDMERQSSGIPGLGDTILFKPRRSSASLENLNAERPFRKCRLVPPPSQRLPTNFDLDVNSTPILFPPSRELKIAEAATWSFWKDGMFVRLIRRCWKLFC